MTFAEMQSRYWVIQSEDVTLQGQWVNQWCLWGFWKPCGRRENMQRVAGWQALQGWMSKGGGGGGLTIFLRRDEAEERRERAAGRMCQVRVWVDLVSDMESFGVEGKEDWRRKEEEMSGTKSGMKTGRGQRMIQQDKEHVMYLTYKHLWTVIAPRWLCLSSLSRSISLTKIK